MRRILDGRIRTSGVTSAGRIFDAPDFLRALSAYLSVGPWEESHAPQFA
ncbi:hypothetical protein [Micromonospora chersina]